MNLNITSNIPVNCTNALREKVSFMGPTDDARQHAPAAPQFSNALTSAFISISWLRTEDQEGECQCQCEHDGHHNDEQDPFSSYTYSGASEDVGVLVGPKHPRRSEPMRTGNELKGGRLVLTLNIARGSAGR